MKISELQEKVRTWTARNFPNSEPWEPLVGVMEELGELSHAHLKQHQGIRYSTMLDKEDAVGDIIIYLADYCNRNKLDLDLCVYTAWKTASQRDWIKYQKDGVSE